MNRPLFRSRVARAGVALSILAGALLPSACSDMERMAPTAPGGSAATNDEAADVARAYFDLSLDLTKATAGFSPPVASRAWGYMGIALYEAVVPGMADHRSLAGMLNGFGNLPAPEDGAAYHWGVAANEALYTIAKRLYATAPFGGTVLASVHEDYDESFAVADDVRDRSKAWGKGIGDAVWAYSISDGGHEGYLRNFPSSYVAPVGEGLWVPTPRPGGLPPQPALLPYWGANRPFILPATGNPNAIADPGPPPAFSWDPASAFYAEALEVYQTGSQGSNLTPEQYVIADFWADNPGQTATPPGHWIAILSDVLRDEESGLGDAAEAYARLGIAVCDAFISCWYTKYEYNLIRPISYIRDPAGPINDPTWDTAVSTPPFPEYTSGHSVQSGAAARVLEALFGADYAFTDDTHVGRVPPLAPRSFASFAEAADEAAISRLYGGIHYRSAIDLGVTQGRKIGDVVNAIPFHR